MKFWCMQEHRMDQTKAQRAAAAIRLALLADEEPTSGFFTASAEEP
jgi:hypothetical protein